MEAFREARWLHNYHSVQQINESSKWDFVFIVFLDKAILWIFGFLESCFILEEFYGRMEKMNRSYSILRFEVVQKIVFWNWEVIEMLTRLSSV